MRYLTSWRTLPDGVFIAESEFIDLPPAAWEAAKGDATYRPFKFGNLVFPTINGLSHRVPHIAFDSKGGLLASGANSDPGDLNEVITLARGSILYHRDASGFVDSFDVRESPPGNSIDNWNRIRIDGLTGRARIERPEIQ